MTIEFEIYYDDLTDEAQVRFDERFGSPEEFNHDITPLAVYQAEAEEVETGEKIRDINELKRLASRDLGVSCYILLNGGLRSSKHITYFDNHFYVFSFIDSTEQRLTEKELIENTNIAEAMAKGCLIRDK